MSNEPVRLDKSTLAWAAPVGITQIAYHFAMV